MMNLFGRKKIVWKYTKRLFRTWGQHVGFCYGAYQLRKCGNTFGAKEISTLSPSPLHFSPADCLTADALTTSNHLQTGHLEGGGDGALEEVSLWLLGASRLFGGLGRANTPNTSYLDTFILRSQRGDGVGTPQEL